MRLGFAAIMFAGIVVLAPGCVRARCYYLRDASTGFVYGPLSQSSGKEQSLQLRNYDLLPESTWAARADEVTDELKRVKVKHVDLTGKTIVEALVEIRKIVPAEDGVPLVELAFDASTLNYSCPARFLHLEFDDVSLLALIEAIPGFSPVNVSYSDGTVTFAPNVDGRFQKGSRD